MTIAIIIFVLVIFSGIFSGSILGLMSLSKDDLEIKMSLGDKDAAKVYSIRKRGNLLLSTLILANVSVNTSISILLGQIVGGVFAGVLATSLIVIFGEILPKATFTRFALKMGARTSWLVKILIIILYPITWPIVWALDKVLGEEMSTIYSKNEIIKIVKHNKGTSQSDINSNEERIVSGALSFSDKIAADIMTPRSLVYSLDSKTKITKKLLQEIAKQGYSRIPVYKENIDNIIGILYVKKMMSVDKGIKIEEIFKKGNFLTISRDIKLDDLLNNLIKSKYHIAVVKDKYNGFEGIVSIDDVIEQIIKKEIVDEYKNGLDIKKSRQSKKRKEASRN